MVEVKSTSCLIAIDDDDLDYKGTVSLPLSQELLICLSRTCPYVLPPLGRLAPPYIS